MQETRTQNPGGLAAAVPANEPPSGRPTVANRGARADLSFGKNRFINQTECCDYMGVSRTKFYEIRNAPDFPKAYKIAGCLRWKLADVDAYIEALQDDSEAAA